MWETRSILEVYVFCSSLCKFFLKLSFYPVCVHTCVFVCVCSCASAHIHMSICMERTKDKLRYHSQVSSSFWGVGLAQNLRIRRCWHHGAAGIPCLCLPCLGLQAQAMPPHSLCLPCGAGWAHVLTLARHTLYQWSHPCNNTVKFLLSFLER